MKHLLTLLLLSSFSIPAFAHPGGHKLVCQSSKNSGSKQKVELSLTRSNGTGWFAPIIEVTVDNKKIELTTPDDMNNYGSTFHNSPLKVITVNADVTFDTGINSGYFSVIAIPATVNAFDIEDKPAVWSLEAEEDECNDSNGRATFQGVLRGYLYQNENQIKLDAQIMDCELTYNSGSAC